jgi:ATP-binding cassette, subfamily B, bacterial
LSNRSASGGSPAALLVVSHRPAVLERADRILALDEGRAASTPRPTAGLSA